VRTALLFTGALWILALGSLLCVRDVRKLTDEAPALASSLGRVAAAGTGTDGPVPS
jgi:hypothetical protein